MRTLPAWVEVDLDALGSNIAVVRQRVGPGVHIMLIVKADAYGHGAVEIAREAIHRGVHMLGVATVDEGRELRIAGIDAAVLLLSPALRDEIPAILDHDLRTTIPDLEFATALSEHAVARGKRVPVHIEADTGMGRSGIDAGEVVDLVTSANRLPGLLVEGLYTHFPVSDTDVEATGVQLTRFLDLVAAVRRAGVEVALVHASNTGGVLGLPRANLGMVRPGGMIYGVMPDAGLAGDPALRPVMSFHARLVQVRRLPAGHGISYGRDCVLSRDSLVGVVPVGYGHGLSRAYSGSGGMLCHGKRVPILGRITMDMTMIDLTDVKSVAVGDPVVVFGRQENAAITVDEIAAATGVIAYEVLCGISKRVVRVYRRDGDVQSMRGLLGVRRLGAEFAPSLGAGPGAA